MTKIILAHKSCFPSARMLRDCVVEITGKKIFVYKKPPKKATEVLLRYGNSVPVNIKDTEYNSTSFIDLTANKLKFSRLMNENKILSPEFRTDTPSRKDFPVMIRTTLTSCGGKGIRVVENISEFNKYYTKGYWTPYIPTNLEIRVHLFIDKGVPTIARIFKKEFESSDGSSEEKYPVRTSRNYHFSLRENESNWKKAIAFSKNVGEVLAGFGGKFCSLDLGYSKDRGSYVIFEANSGSGLNTITSSIYADFLVKQGIFG